MDILQIDQNILMWLNQHFIGINPFLDKVILFAGVYLVYALPIVLLLMWFLIKPKQRALAFAFAGMLIGWFVITKTIVPQIWFRPRPDLALIGAKELLFHRPDYSFPSDHATALFSLTFGLYWFGYKKAANWFLFFSIIICAARVTLGIHFPLDIIGGVASAFIATTLIKLCEKPLDKYVWKPLIKFLKGIRLA